MYLKTLSIRNFRALDDINVEFTPGVNVIVGPNAAGKTTILEAIRFAKSMLAQRTPNESQQTLISLGAASPHAPNQIIRDGLIRDSVQKLEIKCGYEITDDELALITTLRAQIAIKLVQSRLGQSMNPAAFAAYVSSPQGIQALSSAETELATGIKRVETANRICRLDLEINFTSTRMSTSDPIGALLIGFLDQTLPPGQTKFSYFTADRALPRGEVQVQIGGQDSAQQIESHNSQPHLKYNRLKNTIYNTIISSEDGRDILNNEFRRIFSGVLKGRELVGAGVNNHGLLSIKIRDISTGHEFDLDGMSSGEKGLVLTFLLIGRSSADHGVVMLDEPELHLNPAVCKDLLSFIVDNYSTPKNLQIIVCSHSPEILAGAFDRDECALYHLESSKKLSKVRRSDEENINEALRRLGTSESEGLLYKGTIFVEGIHDVELLEFGFSSTTGKFKIKDLGGRQEVEKQIRLLQEAEKSGAKMSPRFFIFDRDDAPSNLISSNNIRVLQWKRRCFENYLIDVDAISELLMDSDVTRTPMKSSGDVALMLKDLAMQHLDSEVIKTVAATKKIDGFSHIPAETLGKSFSESAIILREKIESLKYKMSDLDLSSWASEFEKLCMIERNSLFPIWDADWVSQCNGKRLFSEIQKKVTLNMPILAFKRRILLQMRANKSESWLMVDGLLSCLLTLDINTDGSVIR